VTGPQLLREVKPNYTANAMRAKIQGLVLLECVVLPDGTVGDVAAAEAIQFVGRAARSAGRRADPAAGGVLVLVITRVGSPWRWRDSSRTA
jgi:TonB family protein